MLSLRTCNGIEKSTEQTVTITCNSYALRGAFQRNISATSCATVGSQTQLLTCLPGSLQTPGCISADWVSGNSLETAYQYVRSQMGHKQEKQKYRYNARTHSKAFDVGDQVWLHTPAIPRGK